MASNRSNNKTRTFARLEKTADGKTINRGWTDHAFARRRVPSAPRTPRIPAHVIARTMPDAAHTTTLSVYTPGGVNHGGTCHGCGAMLGFWFVRKVCDRCLAGLPPTKKYGAE